MSLLVDLLVLGVLAAPLVLGGAFVRRGLRERREAEAFAARAVRAEAVVVGLARRRTQDGETVAWLSHPVLRFPDADGREVEVESAVGRLPAPARTGQTVDVLYDPADPTTVRLARPSGGQPGPDLLVAAGVGLAFAAACGGLLLLV